MTLADRKVAVVTGGARGIGLAIGQWFLANGHQVVLLDVDNATLDATQKQLNRPGDVLCLPTDVSSPEQVLAAADQVMGRFGRVDALVNNAGVAVFKPALETTFEEWRHVLSTNLDGAFLCTQAFGAIMARQRSGAVVNIASISGLRASTLRLAYGTSKAALIHLTKQYAAELGNYGVRVNAICPGPVETEMAKVGAQCGHPRRLLRHHPAGPLRQHRRDGRHRGLFVQCAGQLHQRPVHRGRRWL